jgi:biopolymer transport protein ExbD
MRNKLVTAVCLAAMCLPASAGQSHCRSPLSHLRITQAHVVMWEGVAFKDRREMIGKFKSVASEEPQQEISLQLDQNVDYKFVQSVLAEMQKTGVRCVGFTAIEQYVQ